MLVYGDHSQPADPRKRLSQLAERLALIAEMRAGLERHATLVASLVEAGQLLQGVADAGLPDEAALSAFVLHLSRNVTRSWDSGFAEIGALPAVPTVAASEEVELRLPEGFAFYAVYPEAYIEAARRLQLSGPPRVIGIRSIGTTLGAVVAAALGASALVTVRPSGDAFARQVQLPADVLEENAHYVIVDEGPGQSGSSFGAVADWLEARGVPLERIAFLPSHPGDPGPRASEAHRRRWRSAQRVPAEFDTCWLVERFGALEEFSTGSPFERRKFLARRNGETLLLKFAGLGATGERKLEMARALHGAALAPEPLGLVHGFLVERWRDDAGPLAPCDNPVAEIARYIAARARLFPAAPHDGAPVARLHEMMRRNVSLGLGEDAVRALGAWEPRLDRLERRVRRVRTDNKLDRHEWLRVPGGALLKTDALDHHQGHDLIGCQDIAWDAAGAIAEFDLGPEDSNELIRMLARAGRAIDRELLSFCRVAYAAFRFGQASLAGEPAGERQASRLERLLARGDCSATPQESLVG